MKSLSCFLIVMFCMVLPVHAEIYKWVNAKGQIEYSDKPPASPDVKNFEEVKLPIVSGDRVPTHPPVNWRAVELAHSAAWNERELAQRMQHRQAWYNASILDQMYGFDPRYPSLGVPVHRTTGVWGHGFVGAGPRMAGSPPRASGPPQHGSTPVTATHRASGSLRQPNVSAGTRVTGGRGTSSVQSGRR